MDLPSSTLTLEDLRIDGVFPCDVELFPSSELEDEKTTKDTCQSNASLEINPSVVSNPSLPTNSLPVFSDKKEMPFSPMAFPEWESSDKAMEYSSASGEMWPYYSEQSSILCDEPSFSYFTMHNCPSGGTFYSSPSIHETSDLSEYNAYGTEHPMETYSDSNSSIYIDRMKETSETISELIKAIEHATIIAQQGDYFLYQSLQERAHEFLQRTSDYQEIDYSMRYCIMKKLVTLLRVVSSCSTEEQVDSEYQVNEEPIPNTIECTLSDEEEKTCEDSQSYHAIQGTPIVMALNSSYDSIPFHISESDKDTDYCLSTTTSDEEYQYSLTPKRKYKKKEKSIERRLNKPRSNKIITSCRQELPESRHQKSHNIASYSHRTSATSRSRKNYSVDTTRMLMNWYLLNNGETPDNENRDRLASSTQKTPAQISECTSPA
ncbi:hypothetical protein BDF14DRAFT_1801557 [Spinellus fusiger]|nr:hypothetical protein BDF14DRAFT_1801557 [Spinellus fusiger]